MPHYLDDYRGLVGDLMAQHSHQEAMELAVGGGYEVMGEIERKLLIWAGMLSSDWVLDLGCGSGRLPAALHRHEDNISYIGIDIVQELLDYAKTKSSPLARFILHTDTSIPLGDKSLGVVCAFSLFTHLLQVEVYLYLEEMFRVLRPGGIAVVSYQTLKDHWKVFEASVSAYRHFKKPTPHLNEMLTHDMVERMANKVGFRFEGYIDPSMAPWETLEGPSNLALGQEVAILGKPT